MRKTYKLTLPQNKEVESAKIRVENGMAFVDVEFNRHFEPEAGDVIVAKNGSILLYNGWHNPHFYCGFAILGVNLDSIVIDNRKAYLKVSAKGCRFSTPEEKSAFLERLEKECHKRWNPETKHLEDIKWRNEKPGGVFYCIGPFANVLNNYDLFQSSDNNLYEVGNYFRTPEAAQNVAEQIKEIFKNSKSE